MLKAKDIMTQDVITVKENIQVQALAKILSEHKISGVPVTDEMGELVGIVTENDLIDQKKKIHIPTAVALFDSFLFLENPDRLEKDLKKMAASTVGDICSRNLVTVNQDTTLEEIATLMSTENTHTIPVMEEGKMVGIIGKADIIRSIAKD